MNRFAAGDDGENLCPPYLWGIFAACHLDLGSRTLERCRDGAVGMRISLCTFMLTIATAAPALAICGERGGPAFRLPNGKCAGWKDLERSCGTPPTTLCSYEGGGIGATSIEQGKKFIAGIVPAAPLIASGLNQTEPSQAGPAFNKRQVRAEGIACTSQSTTATTALCLVGKAPVNVRRKLMRLLREVTALCWLSVLRQPLKRVRIRSSGSGSGCRERRNPCGHRGI